MIFKDRTILIAGEDRQGDLPLHSILHDEYQVVSALSGSESMKIIKKVHPDLVIVNAVMHDMDRFTLISLLAEDSITSQIPVIMNVSAAEIEDKSHIFPFVADIFLSPIHPELVKVRVRCQLELKQYRDAHRNSSEIDPLVGIANRCFLEDLLRKEWRRALRHQAPQSLIIADIDYFHAYIDYYGQTAGEDCLRQIAAAISKCVKREIDCVARFDEDEFACFLAETDINGAARVASMMSDAVEEINIPHHVSPISDHVTMSFGVASLKPSARLSPDSLISQAEELLAEAQRNGYNQVRSRMS